MGRLFGTDGIRGVVNAGLDAELAYKVGLAAAQVLSEEKKDGRPLFTIGKGHIRHLRLYFVQRHIREPFGLYPAPDIFGIEQFVKQHGLVNSLLHSGQGFILIIPCAFKGLLVQQLYQ